MTLLVDRVSKRRYNTYMNKALELILGLPGVILFCIAIVAGVSMTSTGTSPKEECEAAGGRYVQTMKSYHTCKKESK
jgi:hypothetical protein